MKVKLTKIKLINWHLFDNETISITNNVLISGENGCGKSTLLDAIYFVISGGDDKHFNSAANGRSERKLETYVRGKTGVESEPYLREGDVISYIVLEFYDFKERKSHLIGSEIEYAGAKTLTHFFIIHNYEIHNEDYLNGDEVNDFIKFKTKFKNNDVNFIDISNDSLRDRKRRLGSIFNIDNSDRYFDLLSNALNFKPINDVNQFVNDFLLTKENVDFETLRSSIRGYYEINSQLNKIKDKKIELETFIDDAKKYVQNEKELKLIDYLIDELDIEEINQKIEEDEFDLKKADLKLDEIKESRVQLERKRNKNIEDRTVLNMNDEYQYLNKKNKDYNENEHNLKIYYAKRKELENIISNEDDIKYELDLKYSFTNFLDKDGFSNLIVHLGKYNNELNSLKESLINDKIKLNSAEEELNKQINEDNKDLEDLNNGKNNYPKEVLSLIKFIKSEIKEKFNDANPTVRPICEYFEIKEDNIEWANAIEGYLNENRFDLVIERKYFDYISSLLEEYKGNHKVYGNGIIYFNELKDLILNEESLLNKVSFNGNNEDANNYISSILNEVCCSYDFLNIKNNPISITKDCIEFKNNSLIMVDESIYKIPFIGKNSKKIRIQLLKDELASLKKELDKNNEKREQIDHKLNIINKSKVNIILNSSLENLYLKIDELEENKDKINIEIEEYKNNPSFIKIENKLKELEKDFDNINNESNSLNNDYEFYFGKRTKLETSIESKKESLTKLTEKLKKNSITLNKEDLNVFKEKINLNNKLNISSLKELREDSLNFNNVKTVFLVNKMTNYTNKYNNSLTNTIENLKDYITEYNKLINEDLDEYEEKSRISLESAKKDFELKFLNKIRENIQRASRDIKTLNNSLTSHPFGSEEERYQFVMSKGNGELGKYYDLIMSERTYEKETLFDEELKQEDKDNLKELFEKISFNAELKDNERNSSIYLDYRNYMSYDIKIKDKNGNETYFSKVNKEKSGGETQTPFYIVIASCFDGLMKKGYKQASTSIVMFDEAFNNMDENRIESLMKFYKELNIQIFIVAPTNRLNNIQPHVDTTIGLIKNNNRATIIELKDE